jgi:hypothetical protein
MADDILGVMLTAAQLLERADEYAAQAATATAADIRDALHRLAQRFIVLAGEVAGQDEETD